MVLINEIDDVSIIINVGNRVYFDEVSINLFFIERYYYKVLVYIINWFADSRGKKISDYFPLIGMEVMIVVENFGLDLD